MLKIKDSDNTVLAIEESGMGTGLFFSVGEEDDFDKILAFLTVMDVNELQKRLKAWVDRQSSTSNAVFTGEI